MQQCMLLGHKSQAIPQAVGEVLVPRSFREGRRQVSLAGRVFGTGLSPSWCSG